MLIKREKWDKVGFVTHEYLNSNSEDDETGMVQAGLMVRYRSLGFRNSMDLIKCTPRSAERVPLYANPIFPRALHDHHTMHLCLNDDILDVDGSYGPEASNKTFFWRLGGVGQLEKDGLWFNASFKCKQVNMNTLVF